MFHGTSATQTVPLKKEHILIVEINLSKGCLFPKVKVVHS